ncbi:hypothetical protein GMOD_00006516 [Pyrenophora seminiperda CCB06]|uniref:Uncharacterized protein n=1 Tax=Pyrenophora seminiperda CCB06 TaxID=1302712 RepID=A0A3M7MA96_9PLEO|nr:hypothetical protein GMOD_00006516 [Pyrenophora seminiperda CCB06]
MLEYIYNIVK